jgi:hypothetical protein
MYLRKQSVKVRTGLNLFKIGFNGEQLWTWNETPREMFRSPKAGILLPNFQDAGLHMRILEEGGFSVLHYGVHFVQSNSMDKFPAHSILLAITLTTLTYEYRLWRPPPCGLIFCISRLSHLYKILEIILRITSGFFFPTILSLLFHSTPASTAQGVITWR